MIADFTAIDFETATYERSSICQVGLVRFENGVIVKEFNSLIKPPGNLYYDNLIDVHGITPDDTENAPTFDQIWPEIIEYIKFTDVVAHNGFSFDFQCLDKTLAFYQLEVPQYFKFCTYKIYKNNLAALAKTYGIPLNHHDALSDARACGELFILHLINNDQNG